MNFEVFISYSHRDNELHQQLLVHLSSLERQKKITAWHDREIEAGEEWDGKIRQHIDSARIILLLISPDFVASEYCYGREMQRAMERHETGSALVIPIILRSVYWKDTPFSKLQVLPKEGIPITLWQDRDSALVDVIEGLDRAIQSLSSMSQKKHCAGSIENSSPHHNLPQPDYGRFIGREEEKSKILEKLRPYPYSVNSVVTIDGIGGIGKSALALEVGLIFLREHRKLSVEEQFEAIVWVSAKRTSLKAGRGIVSHTQAFETLNDICETLAVVLQVEEVFDFCKEDR